MIEFENSIIIGSLLLRNLSFKILELIKFIPSFLKCHNLHEYQIHEF